MYKQVLDPVGDSLGWSHALRGAAAASRCSSCSAACKHEGPVGRADRARGGDPGGDRSSTRCRSARRSTPALEGAAFGFFPIMWIVINAIWIYNMTDADRALRRPAPLVQLDLRRPARPGGDHRVLLRRAARGARRLRHAGRDLLGDARGRSASSRSRRRRSRWWPNTAPVAFGAIAIPIVTLGQVDRTCRRTTSARWSAARRRSWR